MIDELAITPDQPPGVGTQEVEEARQLALADPNVRAALRDAGFSGRERDFIVTYIRVQAAAADDPCSTDRCVALFFNTRDAVLDIEPLVNLTTRQVELQ